MWPFKKTVLANEKQLLPVGETEFHQWATRIIVQAGLPIAVTTQSQKFALANLLCELPPSAHMETDAYFITRLRKHAVNQVAVEMRERIRTAEKARLAKEEAKQGAVTPSKDQDGKVVEFQRT